MEWTGHGVKLCFREVIFVFNVPSTPSTLRKSWGPQHLPQLAELVVIGVLALVVSALGAWRYDASLMNMPFSTLFASLFPYIVGAL